MDPVELAHGMQNKQVTDILHRSKEQKYAFDKIFTNESQEQVLFSFYFEMKRVFLFYLVKSSANLILDLQRYL